MGKKQRFYVVWEGAQPGVYHSWEECKSQVLHHPNALYKSFGTLTEAEAAYKENPWRHLGKQGNGMSPGSTRKHAVQEAYPSDPIISKSIAVDAACSGNPGPMEYRGVYVSDGREIFHFGPVEEGTNNIGEFLAIVHALALLKQKGSNLPIYSDSMNAIKWIEKKKCNTKLEVTERNKALFELIDRAEKWLHENSYPNAILKWDTERWGEIPADFGRK
ncbi:MAG: ribonuclease H family protein [Bacteroidota bacterium]|jgi:ribonuclease HI|nr:ribonuclease H family protein [Bacteroidota bacterium]HHU97801.1 ribonuclease H [Petrimonas sp.]